MFRLPFEHSRRFHWSIDTKIPNFTLIWCLKYLHVVRKREHFYTLYVPQKHVINLPCSQFVVNTKLAILSICDFAPGPIISKFILMEASSFHSVGPTLSIVVTCCSINGEALDTKRQEHSNPKSELKQSSNPSEVCHILETI